MTSHELGKALLELPNVTVLAEENGYESDKVEVAIAYFNASKNVVVLDWHADFPTKKDFVFKPDGAVPDSIKCFECDFVGQRDEQKSAYENLHAHVWRSHGTDEANALRERLPAHKPMFYVFCPP